MSSRKMNISEIKKGSMSEFDPIRVSADPIYNTQISNRKKPINLSKGTSSNA